MAQFNPSSLKPASQVAEFAEKNNSARTAKQVVLDGIKRQIELFRNPTADGKRWFTSGATHTAFTLRISNRPLRLQGEETKLAVKTEDFEAAMNHFAKEIEAGKLDEQLDQATKALDDRKSKMRATRQAKKTAQPATK